MKVRRGVIVSFLGVCVVSAFLSSCQHISSSTLSFNTKSDTSAWSKIQDSLEQESAIRPKLIDKWDSLMKNQIVFKTDSILPPVKVQRKQLKDSLIVEFNKHPKHVYLTFDDGPLVGSRMIDSIAAARKIKVSTFLVGRHAKMGKGRQRDLDRYLENAYVACYNHSFTHGYNRFNLFYSNPTTAFEDFEKNETDLALKHKIARLPGRNIWIYDDVRKLDLQSGASTADLLHTNGYRIFGWDVEWRINSPTGVAVQPLHTVTTRIKNFMNNKSSMVPNNVVFLMHDDMFQTQKGTQLLIALIDFLQAENYQFEFMEDYPVKY